MSAAAPRRLVRAGEPSTSRQTSERNDRSGLRQQSTRADSQGDADGDVEGEEDDVLSAVLPKVQVDEQFTKQAWDKQTSLNRLNSLKQEWTAIEKSITDGAGHLAAATVSLAEALRAQDAEGDVIKHEDIVAADLNYRHLLDKIHEASIRRQALESLRQRIQLGEQVTTGQDLYETAAQKALDEYERETSRGKYLDNELYGNFRTELWEACETDAMPALKKFIPTEEGDEEDEEEEIEIAGAVENMKDPITMTWLIKPVRHKNCPHVYSQDAITEYIRQSNGKTQTLCPVSGCNQTVVLDELKVDENLERRVKARQRREQERQETEAGGYDEIGDDDEEDE